MKIVIVKQSTAIVNKRAKKWNFFDLLALMAAALARVSTIVNKIKYKCKKTFGTMHLPVYYACLWFNEFIGVDAIYCN